MKILKLFLKHYPQAAKLVGQELAGEDVWHVAKVAQVGGPGQEQSGGSGETGGEEKADTGWHFLMDF